MANCPRCNDLGYVQSDDSDATVKQCVCAYARALKVHLGPEIAGAPLITSSPLYDHGVTDRTGDDLHLRGEWHANVLPHLKWALGCKGPSFRFRVVTDEKLKNVYVGAESYQARARQKNKEEVVNSLSDLVVGDISLLIIRLGFLGHTNRAMAGVLKETLMLREAASRATWLVDSPDNRWEIGHRAWSEEVSSYVTRRFESLNLTGGDFLVAAPRADEVYDEELGTVSLTPPKREPVVVAPPAPRPRKSPPPEAYREVPVPDTSDGLIDLPQGKKKWGRLCSVYCAA